MSVLCTATITILASRLAAGVVNFDSSDDVVISAAVAGAPASSTAAIIRVVRGPGVYGIVNVPFQVSIQGSSGGDAVMHVTPSSGVVSFLDRQVSNTANDPTTTLLITTIVCLFLCKKLTKLMVTFTNRYM